MTNLNNLNNLSLHKQYGSEAPQVLQGIMQSKVKKIDKLKNMGFTIQNNGNHYIISKDNKSLRVPLFSATEVFTALVKFN